MPPRHPHPHLFAVVVDELDEGFGLKERVPWDRQYAVGVDLHVGRQLSPAGSRLGSEGDLQKSLEQSRVVDPRADTLVVLRVAQAGVPQLMGT